jgi:serine/threonine protein kinase
MVNRTPAPDGGRSAGAASAHALLASVGYVIKRLLADTDRGMVFAASDQSGQEVAIRVTPTVARDARSGTSSGRLSQAGLRLSHPHIVRSIASGERDGQRYVVMEFIGGASLAERVRARGALSEREATVMLSQLSQALGFAARHGLAHPDLTPSDVLLGPARAGVAEPFCAKLSTCSPLRPGAEAAQGDDRRALGSIICWCLTPSSSGGGSRRSDSAASTLKLLGVSPEVMQLLGRMLASPALSWEEVVERSRLLASVQPSGGVA